MTTTSTARRRRPMLRERRRETWYAIAFVLPAAIGFVAFYLVPAVRGVWLSFTNYDLFSPGEFVGGENYAKIVDDHVFWNALLVTLEYVVVNIGLQTAVALLLAALMQRLARSLVIRGILLVPYMVSGVVVALLWQWLLDYQIGIVNNALDFIGLPRQSFFGDPALAIFTVAFINVWKSMGYTALLLFAGLQAIPKDVYEAAAIDGASEVKAFWRVSLPLLRPVLALVLIISLIGSFQIFDTIAVTTKGGPVNATRVIYYYIYDLAFNRYDFGYASAIALVLFVILIGITLIQLRLTRANKSDLA
ncbi:carbohydrate ABC transporter membrane protein 1 (CUT1 family) [Asanoa ferruginea]|uniref:Carbohydrate ABC transporter membrane protein 1 (CUT1 family) n=1 Tax=Asanoa ferruginea TaxID=53367 RepID=A0A3D9ZR21_9ACTN|nr:sugar ABC transporter permease [Asanoa ferruginea]REF98932.1 carbohydrate ABC transporter membrane protein 1 (CUT1 family) [Asanoa ferruginea]